jgi:hypothetical protein
VDKTPVDREMEPFAARRLQLKIAGKASARDRRAIQGAAKHYTWVLLAIAVALLYMGSCVESKYWVRALVILAGCAAGFVAALIGIGVIRREAKSLNKNLEIYDRLAKDLGMDEPAWAASGQVNKGLGALLAGLFGSKKVNMETWDWFQATLALAAVAYALAFVGVLVYSIVR